MGPTWGRGLDDPLNAGFGLCPHSGKDMGLTAGCGFTALLSGEQELGCQVNHTWPSVTGTGFIIPR